MKTLRQNTTSAAARRRDLVRIPEICHRIRNSGLQRRLNKPPASCSIEVLLPAFNGQASERASPIDPSSCFIYRCRTSITCGYLNRCSLEPSRLMQGHRDRQGLLAGGASGTPDAKGPARMGGEPIWEYRLSQCTHLIDFPPEIGFSDRDRVHDVFPFGAGLIVVLEKVIVVEERTEAALHNQGRELVHQQIDF